MKILEHRQLTDLSPAKVQFIRIDPEDISATLADILKVLMDMSWLKNFDEEYERGSFASKANKTIDDIGTVCSCNEFSTHMQLSRRATAFYNWIG